MQVVVDKLMTHYKKSGQGPVLLLLHGWGDKLETFRLLETELLSRFTVLSLDLPGFGGTQAPPKPWILEDYANFVQRFMVKIKEEPYAIIGHSHGGAVAIKGVATNKLTTTKLVLLAAAGIRNDQQLRKGALKVVAKVGKVLVKILPGQSRAKLRHKFYDNIGSDLYIAEHLQDTFKLTVGEDLQTDAAMIAVPTLLIYGDQDTATPPFYGQTFNSLIHGSQLAILPGAGHFVHHDQPAEVATLIEDFLI